MREGRKEGDMGGEGGRGIGKEKDGEQGGGGERGCVSLKQCIYMITHIETGCS